MLKYWRVWLLLVCLLGAVFAIGLKYYPYGRNGVEIVYVSDSSPARGILEQGMIITNINGIQVENLDSWNTQTENLKGSVTLTANGKDYDFLVNETLGIDAMDIERTNLDFGLDIRGGTRIILKPKENATKDVIEQVIATLQTRANIYGLKEIKLYPVGSGTEWYVQVEAAGLGSDVVNELLSRQGSFEAKVLKPVEIENNTGTIQLGTDEYPFTIENETLNINNSIVKPNETFELKGIEFQYLNITGNKVLLLASVYTGDDIEFVYTDPKKSAVFPQDKAWLFYFAVMISETGAKRFADVTTGIPKFLDIQAGEEYLDSKIFLYLDKQLVSELRIASGLGGKIVQTIQIQGTQPTREEAVHEKLRLQTILRSGALPTSLETASVDVISPTLGKGFFSSAILAGGLAVLAVVAIIIIRYKSIRIALPLAFIGISEVVIILGIAAAADVLIWSVVLIVNLCLVLTAWWKKHDIDVYAWTGAVLIPLLGMMSWTIDLPAIGGIIAAIGTGVDDQIIIADEAIKGKEKKVYTLKEKIKRAFFIIFGAAATTIAAMLPLMFLGIGLVRGFAITTIVGVLVGILITRPAYARIIESVVKK